MHYTTIPPVHTYTHSSHIVLTNTHHSCITPQYNLYTRTLILDILYLQIHITYALHHNTTCTHVHSSFTYRTYRYSSLMHYTTIQPVHMYNHTRHIVLTDTHHSSITPQYNLYTRKFILDI